VDLRKRLLGPDAPPPARTRLLVCWLGRRRVAFGVDRVSEVVRLRRSEIKPAPGLRAVGAAPFVVGVCGPPERLKLLLDVKALLLAEAVRDTGRRMQG
jgi:purine-binding chemotaxis protein CheW